MISWSRTLAKISVTSELYAPIELRQVQTLKTSLIESQRRQKYKIEFGVLLKNVEVNMNNASDTPIPTYWDVHRCDIKRFLN